jgi:hypothetical protein
MDVKTMFLHGDLEEEIYIKQPEVICSKGKARVSVQTKNVASPATQAEPHYSKAQYDIYINIYLSICKENFNRQHEHSSTTHNHVELTVNHTCNKHMQFS